MFSLLFQSQDEDEEFDSTDADGKEGEGPDDDKGGDSNSRRQSEDNVCIYRINIIRMLSFGTAFTYFIHLTSRMETRVRKKMRQRPTRATLSMKCKELGMSK